MSSDKLYRWAQVAALCGVSIEDIEDLQITPQASVRCHVGREHSISRPQIVVSEWINENYLIWTLCAGLTESGLDQDWTSRFNIHYRSQWVHIQKIVQYTQGVQRFLLDIRPPPMLMAVFAHGDGPVSHSQAIMSTPASTRPSGGLLKLLRKVYHGGMSLTDAFVVVLYEADVTGVAPESPPYSALGLPDPHAVPLLNLPPPYEPIPESGLAGLPERYLTPPPPYRGTSPAPPDWDP
ncbi:hypothetical protein PEX1_073250 [Penicillium expansum]|uniref:Uncharacterized protein n=1 Tax=Penicillium expansum TaxID=27334 RepID=A0A0A2IGW2_PENEN|nr:hypothetical protein PEX2_006270 [Penicillium expansum]KGO38140.1 hypothetical protein PEX1_073250 [Penicillium expansum]KGO41663.1 hypothetical protein PEXP_088870 [Penicillium expansum]KGO55982.1 hypothetical protein PEX2_006270 [Penicillium expansum]